MHVRRASPVSKSWPSLRKVLSFSAMVLLAHPDKSRAMGFFVLSYDSALCPAKKKGEKSNEMTDDHDHVLQFVLVTRCNGHCEDHTTKFLQWLPSADPWPHKPGNCIKKVHQEKLLPSSDSPPPFVWKPPGSFFLWQKETWAWPCFMARLILYLFKGP